MLTEKIVSWHYVAFMIVDWEGIKPGMERNGMEPIGARVDSKLLAFRFKPLFTQKFCSCSYTTAV